MCKYGLLIGYYNIRFLFLRLGPGKLVMYTLFFYKNVIFWAQAQNFLKNPDFSLKKILILTLFPG